MDTPDDEAALRQYHRRMIGYHLQIAKQGHVAIRKECHESMKTILKGLKYGSLAHGLATPIDRHFELFQCLEAQEQQHALESLASLFSAHIDSNDECVDYNSAVRLYANFLKTACSNGFDAHVFFARKFSAKSECSEDVFEKVTAKLPLKHVDDYAGQSVCAVLCAAFLMNQSDDALLACCLSADTLLSLYVLKGNGRYKEALRTPEKADVLLANELGL